jgi:hypothetical protein
VDSSCAPLIVFAQRADLSIDIDAWNAHATRFFATRLGFAEVPPTGGPMTARFVVAPDGDTPGIRRVFMRPRDSEDLALAEAADARVGFTGLALLARRCPDVWLVERISTADTIALQLAAILASLFLGPILDTIAGELFGVKTARQKLA